MKSSLHMSRGAEEAITMSQRGSLALYFFPLILFGMGERY